MQNKTEKRDILLREIKTLTNKNLMEIEGKISFKKLRQQKWVFTSIFYLTIFFNMERKDPEKTITMQLSPLGILSIKEGIQELIDNRELIKSNLVIYSGGNKASKKLQIASDADLFYLNFFEDKKKITLALTIYEAKALLIIIKEAVNQIFSTEDDYRQKAQLNKKEKN